MEHRFLVHVFRCTAPVVIFVAMANSIFGCDESSVPIDDIESICGPCGTVANGDATISGNAQLDGIFKAVGTLKMSTGSIKAGFDGRVKNIAAILDIDVEGMATADIIAEIETEFGAQITGHLDGGLTVDFVEPRCSANISVSASASAQCEAKAGCDVDVSAECDPGELSFKCEGSCTGKCEVVAEGSCTAKLEAGVECTGSCSGACDLSAEGGSCEGTCSGTCDGECNGTCDGTWNGTTCEGTCEGECSATCTGSCQMPSAGGSCSGECKGECTMVVEAGASCEGKFEGECEAGCSGGCEGSFEPPSCDVEASASCDASADCQAQAEAQASASLECTPPSIDISYHFSAGVDASAQAEIMGKLEMFKVEMIGVVKGMFELRGLIEGNAELDIEPPVVTIGYAIEDFMDVVASGEFEVEAVGLLPCVIPAFEESFSVVTDMPGEMAGTISGQLSLFALIQ